MRGLRAIFRLPNALVPETGKKMRRDLAGRQPEIFLGKLCRLKSGRGICNKLISPPQKQSILHKDPIKVNWSKRFWSREMLMKYQLNIYYSESLSPDERWTKSKLKKN